MVKRVDNAVYSIVQDVVNHMFRAGFHVYGLEQDGVGYSVDQYNRDLLTPAMIQDAESAKRKIIAGQITVTDAIGQ
jgi:basic membrane protein A